MRGYRTNVVWFPEHGVGAVVLTNSDTGNVLMDAFPRRLAEVLIDGVPDAEAAVTAAAADARAATAARRALLAIPASPSVLAGLAAYYRNPVLGDVRIAARRGVRSLSCARSARRSRRARIPMVPSRWWGCRPGGRPSCSSVRATDGAR
ncbi:MAG TPA: hypothetical protein VK427_16940 [Kofleriaceae bacterium]|nr:hypothetical protein [Kofleriaceae bacterium]